MALCLLHRIAPDIVDTVFCTAAKKLPVADLTAVGTKIAKTGLKALYVKLANAYGCSQDAYVLFG